MISLATSPANSRSLAEDLAVRGVDLVVLGVDVVFLAVVGCFDVSLPWE